MPLFLYLLTLLVIFPLAVPATRAQMLRHGLHKNCPTCSKDAKGRGGTATASSDRPGEDSTVALGQGELCGVYTLSCARGLRCNPPPGDPNPLHALLHGRGICSNLRSPAAGSPQTTGKTCQTILRERGFFSFWWWLWWWRREGGWGAGGLWFGSVLRTAVFPSLRSVTENGIFLEFSRPTKPLVTLISLLLTALLLTSFLEPGAIKPCALGSLKVWGRRCCFSCFSVVEFHFGECL